MSAPTKTPPKREGVRKAPIDAEYEDKAKALLRNAMKQRGVDVHGLAELLNEMGIKISAGGLANKISRGGFSSAFLLQCAEALDTNVVTLPR